MMPCAAAAGPCSWPDPGTAPAACRGESSVQLLPLPFPPAQHGLCRHVLRGAGGGAPPADGVLGHRGRPGGAGAQPALGHVDSPGLQGCGAGTASCKLMHGAPGCPPSAPSVCLPGPSAVSCFRLSLHTARLHWLQFTAGQPSCMSFSKFRAWQLTQYEKVGGPAAERPLRAGPAGTRAANRQLESASAGLRRQRGPRKAHGTAGLPVACSLQAPRRNNPEPPARARLDGSLPRSTPHRHSAHPHNITLGPSPGAGPGHRHDFCAVPRRPAGLVRRRRAGGHPRHGARRLPAKRCASPGWQPRQESKSTRANLPRASSVPVGVRRRQQ